MFTFPFNQSKKYVSIIALAGVMALSACGSSSKDNNETPSETTVDTSNLTEMKLRENITTGLTQGISSNISALTSVAANSKVFGKIAEKSSTSNQTPTRLKQMPRENNGLIILNQGDFTSKISTNALDSFSRMIDLSNIDQNKNVYSFDPNEAQVCSDPAGTGIAETSTAEEIANCQTLLSHITFVVTVTKMENKEVTAATTLFKYDDAIFAKTGFDKTSGYYEILLPGMRSLLLGVNEISMEEDKIDIPTTMEGSVRVAFTAPTENSGSFKISIPTAVKLISNITGEETKVELATTSQLFSLAANSDTNSMEAVVSLNALNVLMTEKAESGSSFPVELALSALTGKAAVTNNGDQLKIVGLSAEGVKLKVDKLEAMSLNLKPLDALIDSSGTKSTITLSKLLDFSLSQTNIRHYFESDGLTTDTLGVDIKADNGTTLTEYTDNVVQLVTGNLSIKVSGIEEAFEVDASTGNCLSNSFEVIECPAQNQ